jgi:phospholipid/cholesterol/gamma-HCH transport system substrate-binding protein
MKRGNDFAVGLTMLGGIVILLAAIIWVKEVKLGARETHMSARFRDVGNVKMGTPVVVRGVRTGRVDRMELADDGFVQIRMALDPSVKLPTRPVVLLNESSLFGEWQATIIERDAVARDEDVSRQLADATRGGDVLPGATLPDIAKLTAVAGRIAGDVASVADRVHVAFDDQAARELRLSIRNFSDLSTVLAQTVREQSNNLTTTSAGVRGGVESLARSAELMRAVAERVDSSTSKGEINKIVSDAGEAARQLRETSQRLLSISEQLGRSQGRLESFLTTSDSIAFKINTGRGSLGMMVNDPGLYRNIDSLTRELRGLLDDIHKNPKRYINVRIF